MKNKGPVRRSWRKAIGCLLILVTTPAALFGAWEIVCASTPEVALSTDYRQRVFSSDRSEVALIRLFYRGMSADATLRGTVGFPFIYSFNYRCNSANCDLIRAEVWVGVSDFPICTFVRRLVATVIEIHLHELDQDNPRVEFVQWRSGGLTKLKYIPEWNEVSADIAAIKAFARSRIENDVWNTHSTLYMDLRHGLDSWTVYVRSIRPNEQIYYGKVDPSEYESFKARKR